jgi:hypothetical protein
MWVIGGRDSGYSYRKDVWYSGDGATWTKATSLALWPARAHFSCTVLDGRMWILGGQTGASPYRLNDVWWSTDGAQWTCATDSAGWAGRYWHAACAYDDRMWVMGGTTTSGPASDVWYSNDGVDWQMQTASAAWGERYGHASAVHTVDSVERIWVLGGHLGNLVNDVWYWP